jgi:hypothetical protein
MPSEALPLITMCTQTPTPWSLSCHVCQQQHGTQHRTDGFKNGVSTMDHPAWMTFCAHKIEIGFGSRSGPSTQPKQPPATLWGVLPCKQSPDCMFKNKTTQPCTVNSHSPCASALPHSRVQSIDTCPAATVAQRRSGQKAVMKAPP